jgi:hypothetical protein
MPHFQISAFPTLVHCIASLRSANWYATWIAATFRFTTSAEILAVIFIVTIFSRWLSMSNMHVLRRVQPSHSTLKIDIDVSSFRGPFPSAVHAHN